MDGSTLMLVAVVVIVGGGLLAARLLRRSAGEAGRHAALAEERRDENERLNGELSDLRARLEEEARQRTLVEAGKRAAEEKIALLTEIREGMEAKFGELAAKALELQGEKFSKANLEKLDATLTPLKEHVGHFEKELKAVHKATVEERARLKAEIEQLGKRSEQISREATDLTRALKGDQRRQGAWGEMILEGILERSGLREGEEYELQAHRTGDDGRSLRPDAVVRIPGGKTLVIDSKVSLTAYAEAVSAEEEGVAADARKSHVDSLKRHIDNLASKNYQRAEDMTVDYVILFVPIEGAFSEALRADGRLAEYALERNVTLATPTTLMMALKTIEHVWAVVRRNRNAEEIARRAGLLYEKVAGFVDSMEDVGRRLGQARDAHVKAFGQLSTGRGNVLSQIETLKTLGAKTGKSLGVPFDGDGDDPEDGPGDESGDAPGRIGSGGAGGGEVETARP